MHTDGHSPPAELASVEGHDFALQRPLANSVLLTTELVSIVPEFGWPGISTGGLGGAEVVRFAAGRADLDQFVE